MDTLAFLEKVWPRLGFYCLAVTTPKGVRHKWFETIEAAAAAAQAMDERGSTVYFACSTFTTTVNRKGANAAYVRSLWLDLDVGAASTKFASREEAGRALKEFLTKHGLPKPTIVDSGGGFHVYFTYTEDVPIDRAKPVAALLKAVAQADGFKLDPTRTADMSSILRPVGTRNHKYDPPRLVAPVVESPSVAFNDLAQIVLTAAKGLKTLLKPKQTDPNKEFLITTDYPPCNPELVADRCAQIGAIRGWRMAGKHISEPQWYGALQVIHFCEAGDETFHKWSQENPHYKPEHTDAKIKQIEGFGPTTCAVFEQRNPDGCLGCPHRGKVTSPIQLGVRFEELASPPQRDATRHVDSDDDETELTDEQFIAPPHPFKRTKQGIAYVNPDGIEVLVYPYDMYLHEIAFDDANQYEVTIVRHFLVNEGWLEFSFRSSEVGSERDFERVMRDNHIKPGNTKLLRLYVMLYMSELQKRKKMRQLYSSMGWHDGTSYFVLGERAYYADGTMRNVGISSSIAKVATGFRVHGDADKWIAATEILNAPGMEAHALMFGAGAGAPLMKFTGFEGALFNAVARSNTGKTSIARFFTSMYGDFEQLKLKQKDTENAKIGRIGMFSSLPVYVDEVTNEDPEKVSDFVYEITQGRSKLRLRIDGTERPTYTWNTIVVSSSNSSLSAKLGVAKANPEAERLRLFEFRVERQAAFDDGTAQRLYRTLADNYGHAGRVLIQYVVTHQDEVRQGLDAMIAALKTASAARGEERMWLASVGCALYGMHLMAQLGLLRVDVKRIAKWASNQIRIARQTMDDARSDPIDVLGQYLSHFASGVLAVKEIPNSPRSDKVEYQVEQAPHGPIIGRFDVTTNRLYVNLRHFRNYLAVQQEDWKDLREALMREGVVTGKQRKCLGAGTRYPTASIECIEIDTTSPLLGNQIMKLVPGLETTPVPRRGAG